MKRRKQVEELRGWIEALMMKRYASASEHGSASDTSPDTLARRDPSAHIWFRWNCGDSIGIEVNSSDYRCISIHGSDYDADEDFKEFGTVSIQYSDDGSAFRDESDERMLTTFLYRIRRFGAESAAEIAVSAFIRETAS